MPELEHYTRNEKGHFVEVDEEDVFENLVNERYDLTTEELDSIVDWHETPTFLGKFLGWVALGGRNR